MLWQKIPWPEFLKKRLCRYLLQHYLGHFFKEKISLEQLTIDIYNGTGCVKNLHLDCEALNEQLDSMSNLSSSSSSTSTMPFEVVNGFVGYISVYIPWHDLFNDYCKLTIKNVQITIRTKQMKSTSPPQSASFGNQVPVDEDLFMSSDDQQQQQASMFSSTFVDSLMNTSMYIAKECLNTNSNSNMNINEESSSSSSEDEEEKGSKNAKNNANSLLGLEAFASTIDSILSHIKINLEQIQIRVENLDHSFTTTSHYDVTDILNSSTMFNSRPASGIALELRIKSIKYFDLDSVQKREQQTTSTETSTTTESINPSTPAPPTSPPPTTTTTTTSSLSNATKSFNIEGFTIYFDEFVVRDIDPSSDVVLNPAGPTLVPQSQSPGGSSLSNSVSLNSTVDLSGSSISSSSDHTTTEYQPSTSPPRDESAHFNFELNPDYYLATNPCICCTFSGIQTIRLTITNMRPTDLILEEGSQSEEKKTKDENPLLEVNAQFGCVKMLLCPKQIHLLIEMADKVQMYVQTAQALNARKRRLLMHRVKQRAQYSSINGANNKPIRGCDRKKLEALIQNDLLNDDPALLEKISIELEKSESSEEQSQMFYSMLSSEELGKTKSMLNSNNEFLFKDLNEEEEPKIIPDNDFNEQLREDKVQQKFLSQMKQNLEQLQQDAIVATVAGTNRKNNNNAYQMFQTLKCTVRMFSITVLHRDPLTSLTTISSSSKTSKPSTSSPPMKSISDFYFDHVSTIDAVVPASAGTTSFTIERGTVLKYHQACAFHDHFLFLLRPLNLNLIQKINQTRNGSKQQQQQQYSMNDIAFSIGFAKLDEYLIGNPSHDTASNKQTTSNQNKRFKLLAQMNEACQQATITEFLSFMPQQDQETSMQQSEQKLEQPCFKLKMLIYEPLNDPSLMFSPVKGASSRRIENISIQLTQCLLLEVDFSLMDRLFYLLNFNNSNSRMRQQQKSFLLMTNKTDYDLEEKIQPVFTNLELSCSQLIKVALRFPIADLQQSTSTKKKQKPTSMLNLRCVRDQIMTVHLFDFQFQTSLSNHQDIDEFYNQDKQLLTVTCAQLNAYYQYVRNARPIHFALIQQKPNQPRSFICSIQFPRSEEGKKTKHHHKHSGTDNKQQLNNENLYPTVAFDSLKTNYNINVGRANKLFSYTQQKSQTIHEENEDEEDIKSQTMDNSAHSEKKRRRRKQENSSYLSTAAVEGGHEDEEEEEEEDTDYGPFSRIYSLISSEKNRRIVNAGNKHELATFTRDAQRHSQLVICLNLPNLKCLIADQKFLNDIYNCFVNDLLMWMPYNEPPLDSPSQPNKSSSSSMVQQDQVNSLANLIEFSCFDPLHWKRQVSLQEYQQQTQDNKQFFMCKSAIQKDEVEKEDSSSLNSENESSSSDSTSSISDSSSISENGSSGNSSEEQQFDDTKKNKMKRKKKKRNIKSSICFVLNCDQAHLKAFVLNTNETATANANTPLKYGEFDVRARLFRVCVQANTYSHDSGVNGSSGNSEETTPDKGKHQSQQNPNFMFFNRSSNSKKRKKRKYLSKKKEKKVINNPSNNTTIATIEKQYISISTEYLHIAHATKQCQLQVQQLKYPTNCTSFEALFQMSKTQELITSNDPNVNSCLFTTETGVTDQQSVVSIAIKSRFDSATNTKQLLMAMNFNALTLKHQFCAQSDFWIFQLIELFRLVDIEISGYQMPTVLTELHLNVNNSCVAYRPVHLSTKCLLAFKSLHWSSNVTAEASSTLLVFNIEDIYLFLSKVNSEQMNLKRDYICVANSDLFELRLLINEEEKRTGVLQDKPELDIKIRSNLIQVRSCVDSAFGLIELINYIVSDGDLHQTALQMSEFMSAQAQVPAPAAPQPPPSNLTSNLTEIFNNSPETEPEPVITSSPLSFSVPLRSISSMSNLQKALNSATNGGNTSPIPIHHIQHQQPHQPANSPATSSNSYKSSTSSSSLMMGYHNSPLKATAAMAMAPLPPSPSLSLNKTINSAQTAESLISDMVKEAMNTAAASNNMMTQSVYGNLSTQLDQRNRDLKRTNIKKKEKKKIIDPNQDDDFLIRKLTANLKDIELQNSDSEEDENSSSEDQLMFQSNSTTKEEEEAAPTVIIKTKSKNNENDEFHFDLPFSDQLSPMSPLSSSGVAAAEIKKQKKKKKPRKLHFDKNNRRLYFKPKPSLDDDGQTRCGYDYEDELGILGQRNNDSSSEDDEEDEEEDDGNYDREDMELLRDFDIIDLLPGFGEPPRNNQEFEIKAIRTDPASNQSSYVPHGEPQPGVQLREDHFKKPLTKIDVLKAPDTYPTPLNAYCIQEISVNWCLYGGCDFENSDFGVFVVNDNNQNQNKDQQLSPQSPKQMSVMMMNNRTVSSPIFVTNNQNKVNQQQPSSPNQISMHYTAGGGSPSSLTSGSVRFKNLKQQQQQSTSLGNSKRKAGGRILNKYDTHGMNWMARGGLHRNLDMCMEIGLNKIKTKIDIYSNGEEEQQQSNAKENKNKRSPLSNTLAGVTTTVTTTPAISPYLYRVALAIGDIEIRDKLHTSPFNMFLFRYESEHCPKHTNSSMLFLKFLCSRSMDEQRLLECDIKLSIQPLRFNIDQDALIFLVEYFTKMASRDLNEFSRSLVPPPPSPPAPAPTLPSTPLPQTEPQQFYSPGPQQQQQQQIFIRNFIFSPDLFIRFDFSGKYAANSTLKLDTHLKKLLMVAVQLSNTEIKLKRVCFRRGFLGAEKVCAALLREWLADIQRNQMRQLIKGWGIFNSLIQFVEGFTYLIWMPIEQYRKDGRLLCGIQKGSVAFSTCTVLATIELTNRMFQVTKSIAEFFYDLVTPHRANSLESTGSGSSTSYNALFANGTYYSSQFYQPGGISVESIFSGVAVANRNIRMRQHPNDIREGFTNAYYVLYEGLNDTANSFMQEISEGAEHKGLPGAIGGALRQIPSAALAPIVLTTEATCNILSGIRNQLKPDEKRDDDQKWKTIAFNS